MSIPPPPPPKPSKPKPRADAGKVCPSCGTAVPAGKSRCPKCDLEVNKMNAFAAAKAAAEARGLKETKVEGKGPIWKRPAFVVGVLLGICFMLGLWAFLQKAPPPPWWSTYPMTRTSAVEQFLGDIATGKDEGYAAAYGLVSPELKNKDDRDELGRYRQLYHNMNRYLTGQFGEGWEKNAVITEDPKNPDSLTVKVELETLHIGVKQETPADVLARVGQHFTITGVDEFPISEAADAQQKAAIMGLVGGYAGQGAVRNLNTIMGATANAKLSKMERKTMLLPILADPRETVRRTVIQAWPLRKDPVMRARLEQMVGDGRYQSDVRQTAKEVLEERVDETDLIAAGVPDD